MQRILFWGGVFIAGSTTLILEILGVRLLAPFFGSTIFVWSSLITTTLGGLALGYFIGASISKRQVHKITLFYAIFLINGLLFIIVTYATRPLSLATQAFGLRFGSLFSALILFFPIFFLEGINAPIAVSILGEHTSSGDAAGKLYAFSTLGSLVGGLLAGFFLIPLLPLSLLFKWTGIILAAIGIGGLFFSKNKKRAASGLLAIIIILLIPLFFSTQKESWIHVLDRKSTFYSELNVAEFSGERCLFSGLALHGCIESNTGEPPSHIALIQTVINSALQRLQAGNNVLVLGGGTGTLIKKLPKGVRATLVELDPATIDLGKQYFGLHTSENTEVIIDDARHALVTLSKEQKRFNLIILDAFSDITLPSHLASKEAMAALSNILSSEGLIIINGGIAFEKPSNDDIAIGSLLLTAQTSFSWTRAFWGNDGNSSNIIFLLSHEPKPIPDIPELAADPKGIVLSDDFNPLEYYSLKRGIRTTEALVALFSRPLSQ